MKKKLYIKKRDIYISKIKPFMRKSLVKVMVGHRRGGKSYILYQLMDLIREEEPGANIIYINKEFAENTCDTYCTGSNVAMLSSELATFLSGRYIEFKVYSLTYAENFWSFIN